MLRGFDRRTKTAPSHYPRIPFHGIRCAQLVSSLIVGGIMSYFIWHLTHDHWDTPWTFIWLSSASLFSIAALLLTMVLHCFSGLNPKFNLFLNGGLLILWTLSWSLLTWYMSGTLRNMCDIEHWKEETGIMVCRIYKALFTFTLTGFVSTIAAFALDIYVFRSHTRLGIYKLQDLDGKAQLNPTASRGHFADEEPHYGAGGLDAPRESGEWDEPRPSIGPYDPVRESGHDENQGYRSPSAQFDYDTEYRGGAH